MNFQVPPVNANGPGDAANLAVRGPDPLLNLPQQHVLRNCGFNLIATPGGIANTLDNINASAGIAPAYLAARPDVATRNMNFFLTALLPQKADAIFAQLGAEPVGRGRLDLGATYASPEAFHEAVHRAVAELDPANRRTARGGAARDCGEIGSCAGLAVGLRVACAPARCVARGGNPQSVAGLAVGLRVACAPASPLSVFCASHHHPLLPPVCIGMSSLS